MAHPWELITPFKVSVEQYRSFRRDGFLIVRKLVLPEHVEEIRQFTEDLMHGRVTVSMAEPPQPNDTPDDRIKRLLRVHMLHCESELAERYMLYPRVLDVVQALTGPDILALQTMLFIRAPGSEGQGWHQDSYYIPTFPDSLLGAWIAVDPVDEENGCMFMLPGSNHEPIYPPKSGHGYGDWGLKDIPEVSGVGGHSNSDEDPQNELNPIVKSQQASPIACVMEPGDVAFFGGHILHRSYSNRSTDRMRRAFVNHYCNARSFTPWLDGNKSHILARGNTTLGFAQPRFGTPCSALNPQKSISDRGSVPDMMLGDEDGMMSPGQPSATPDPH